VSEAVITIKLPERFDFSYHKEFYNKTAEVLADHKHREVEMDFSRVEYLDSSALGMLVMLQKKCAEVGKQVVVVNASGLAADILKIANMEKIVEIR
jgi:anti-anti-sigma factor